MDYEHFSGYRLVVKATPLECRSAIRLPFDPTRLEAEAFVGDVVLTAELTNRALASVFGKLHPIRWHTADSDAGGVRSTRRSGLQWLRSPIARIAFRCC
jgi:hypothetical protein